MPLAGAGFRDVLLGDSLGLSAYRTSQSQLYTALCCDQVEVVSLLREKHTCTRARSSLPHSEKHTQENGLSGRTRAEAAEEKLSASDYLPAGVEEIERRNISCCCWFIPSLRCP